MGNFFGITGLIYLGFAAWNGDGRSMSESYLDGKE